MKNFLSKKKTNKKNITTVLIKFARSPIMNDKNNILEIDISEKFIGERGRINCSLRAGKGYWRWLGVQYVVSEK